LVLLKALKSRDGSILVERERFEFIELAYEFPLYYSPPQGEDYFLYPAQIAGEIGLKPAIFTIRTPLTPQKKQVINGIDVFRFNSVFSILRRLIRVSPTLAHGHSLGWLPATFAPLLVRKYVFTPHAYRLDVYPKWKVNFALLPIKNSDAIITRTKCETGQFKDFLSESKIHLIPIPIDYDFFAATKKEWIMEIRRRYGLSDDDRLILSVTNPRPIKNLETLIRSFAIVNTKFSSSKLIIVGGEPLSLLGLFSTNKPKSNYTYELTRLAMSLGIKKDVFFTGYQNAEELRKFYAASEIFCMPSWIEGQLLAAGEAASAGLPLVLSDLKTLREIYSECALFHDPLNYKQLASHVIRLLENPKLAKTLGNAGRIKMQNYRPEIIHAKLRKLYESLLS
jgi:glycosyltransferase involved in cell wall biosynthesis